MIKYALKCAEEHRFEGWFSDSADYDRQAADGLLECPVCGSREVKKELMAPAVATSRKREEAATKLKAFQTAMNESARRARDYVEKNFDHVGKQFPEEARKIHYGETPDRPIYGDATPKEVSELKDEGIAVAPVPEPVKTPTETKRKLN